MAQRQWRSDDTSPWNYGYGNGSEGALTISATTADSARSGYANTTFSATSGSTSATAGSGTGFAAGDLILIHQSRNGGAGAGAWELNKISSIGGGTNWTLEHATIQAYDTTAQVYRLAQFSTVTINSSQTLNGVDWDGTKGGIIALLANTSITVTGIIDHKGTAGTSGSNSVAGATGGGYRGGTGLGASSNNSAYQGEGTAGTVDAARTTAANGSGGGGASVAGGSSDPGGGGGGNGGAGTAGQPSINSGAGGTGGSTAGNAGLTTMVFGGGGGGKHHQDGASTGGGASGGGILILIAPTITVTGSITLNGGASAGGNGGGCGAGGSLLLKGKDINIGTALITATGGGGGNAGSGDGGTGRIHADYLNTITGSSTPTLDYRQDTSLVEPPSSEGTGYFFFM